jgi:dTMP kinase
MTAARRPGGFFITFEGPEGSGKSTQSFRLQRRLAPRDVIVIREPGGTELGEQVRAILLTAQGAPPLSPWAEACLFSAARAQLVRDVIGPALNAGRVVICDRFADSTLAYQGYARGLDLTVLTALQDSLTGGLRPDLTILFDLPVETGLERIPLERRDRLDQESRAFHQRVRDGYMRMAAEAPHRWVTVDATRDPDAVGEDILAVVEQRLKAAGKMRARRSA